MYTNGFNNIQSEIIKPVLISRFSIRFYNLNGIIPLMPISTTWSPFEGSKVPGPDTSLHSKLLLVDKETTIVISEVSEPVITSGDANCPVTTQEPAGMGDVANNGLGTVVAPAGACPELTNPKPETLVSNAQ